MAPAASLLPATSVAAASKRPAASDAEPLDSSSLPPQGGDQDAAPKNQQQQQLECPRCGSTNTKFCYYNNYSTAQPRHLCRACRRYWTKGGTLRDVPVGGASRRGGNKRRRVSAEPSSASSPPPTPARAEDAYPDLPIFPFLSDGIFLPQFDLGVNVAPAAFSWPSAVPNYFYDGLAPWDDGTRGVGVTGAWDNFTDIVGLSWPPPDGN